MSVLVEESGVRLSRLRLGPWETNTYIIVCLTTKTSLVVDAPAEANRIVEEVKGTTLKYILLTHNHLDHIGALTELRNKTKAPLGCHALDATATATTPEIRLTGGEQLDLGKLTVEVIYTPGHTRGSMCFKVGKYLVSGDTIFPGGPGNTRSSGDFKEILRSIRDMIMVLPDETIVYPGHGEPTTLKKEREEFAAFTAKQHSSDLHGDVQWLSS